MDNRGSNLTNHLYARNEVTSGNRPSLQEAAPRSYTMATSNPSYCYLACTPSKASSWTSISSFMHSLGCSSFNKLFWRVPICRLRAVLSHPGLSKALVLRRSRKLVRHKITERDGSIQLGSFIVIAYKLGEPSRRIRKTVQRALQRAPCFRLCPSVYAFPQLRNGMGAKSQSLIGHPNHKHGIITPRELTEILAKCNARVFRVSRLVLLDKTMEDDLVERMVSIRRAQCRKLVQACKCIASSIRLQRSEYFSVKAQKLKLSEIRFRYRAVRSVLLFFRKELGINMSDELSRASRAISSCHEALKRVEETRASVAMESAN